MTDQVTSPAEGVNPASRIAPADPVMGDPQNSPASPPSDGNGAQATPDSEDPAKAAGDKQAQGEDEHDSKGKRRNRTTAQERISELTRRARQAEADRDQAIARAERLSRPLKSDRDPAELSFDESEKLRLRQAFREESAAQADFEARERDRQALQHRNAVFSAKVEAVAERFPDLWQRFDQVPCSQFAADFIVGSDKTIELAHFLASNPQEAARIARMPDAHQGIALARIEGRLSQAPASRKVSSAPPPPTRVVTGASASGAKDPADMTYPEYVAWMESRGQ